MVLPISIKERLHRDKEPFTLRADTRLAGRMPSINSPLARCEHARFIEGWKRWPSLLQLKFHGSSFLVASSRGCHEDTTSKLLPWNWIFIERGARWCRNDNADACVPLIAARARAVPCLPCRAVLGVFDPVLTTACSRTWRSYQCRRQYRYLYRTPSIAFRQCAEIWKSLCRRYV